MGNGFPVAGIAIAPEIVESFGNDVRYFNTFGGNSVAIAAAQATLDIIRDESLLANSKEIGAIIQGGLRSLAERFEFLGDIRGAGLYVGVEIVKECAAKTPDGARAAALVNGLRERRVLISATGPHANTLKIRPPLVFNAADAGRLLETLELVLGEV